MRSQTFRHPHDQANLYYLTLDELVQIYSPQPKEPYSRFRNRILTLKRYVKGKPMPPKNPEFDGNLEAEAQRAAARQGVARQAGNRAVAGHIQFTVPEAHATYHQDLEDALNEHGVLNRASFTDWQGFSKDADGNPQIVDLHRKRFDVVFNAEPKWLPVTRVESQVLPKKESRKAPGATKTAVILPDLQIPFHSPEAVDVALQIVRDTKPDKIILLGDSLDLSAWSKYTQKPEWATATQDAIVELHKLLALLRKMSPTADIVVLEGNHDLRMQNNLLQNAQAAYGLKRADDLDGWPVMSVPYLAAFDQLGVEYIDGYPANRHWINERLQVRHGDKVRSGASTARAVSQDERVSTIFGHIHRIETQYKTVNVYEGGRTSFAHTPGCLCRIDGGVPSVKGGTNIRTGQPVKNYEDWQNGLAVVSYRDGDAPFNLEQVYIDSMGGYTAMHRGRVYEPIQSKES